jgi:serine/threonine protein kinase
MEHNNEKTTLRTTSVTLPDSNTNRDMRTGGNELPAGMRLSEFEIVRLIGKGGFGIVYLAYDHSLGRHVALKEYLPSSMAFRDGTGNVRVTSPHYTETFNAGMKSFINEARLLARFDSAALVKVHRFWEANGTAYMVMPFYEGSTLKQAYQERKVVPDEPWLRTLLADLLDAIETIHQAYCLHRDIAPDNILLRMDGRPLLLDFGAARHVIGDMTHDLTAIVKPGFAPLEQYADIPGLKQGPWTDVYALGAVIYYLIAGKAPPVAVARSVNDEMLPARKFGKGRYSESFLGVIDHALAVRPEQRIQSVPALRQALASEDETRLHPPRTPTQPVEPTPEAVLSIRNSTPAPEGAEVSSDATVGLRPPTPPQPEASRLMAGTRRRRWRYALLALALIAGIAAAPGLWYWGFNQWERSRPHTELTEAAASGDMDKLKRAFADGSDVNARGGDGLTALQWAARNGHPAAVNELIAAKANVHVEARGGPISGNTALDFAAFDSGNVEVIRALIVAGAAVDHQDAGGNTPLMGAAVKGHVLAVEALIAAGADVNRRSNAGLTPLQYATGYSDKPLYPDVVTILKAAGARD